MSPHFARTIATGLAAAAIAAPAAQANPAREPGSGYAGPVQGTGERVDAPAVVTTIDEGFDLGSAAIGAGGAGMLILLSLGGTAHVSRARARVHGA